MAEAYARARRAQESWARTPLAERAEVLLRLHDLVLDRQDEILDLIVLGVRQGPQARLRRAGAHRADRPLLRPHRGAAPRAPDGCSAWCPGSPGSRSTACPRASSASSRPGTTRSRWRCATASPRCSPATRSSPSPTPRPCCRALLGAQLLEEAGLPADLWQVVAGPGPELGPAIIEGADYVCFTGSTATGRIIAQQCAERLIGCSLELGGKNPILVLRDADIEKAAEGAVRASFSNAGQLCVSMERMFVADQVYDRFVDRFVARTEAMTLGASLEWGVDMGSLISQQQLDTVTAHVEDAVAKGARVLTGGKARPDLGPFFYEPTILEGVTPDMTCFGHETFGPVIALYRFHDEGEAVDRANDGEYGLNALDLQPGRRPGPRDRGAASSAARSTSTRPFGATFGSIDSPMGGMRQSGHGPPAGRARASTATPRPQAVATQRLIRFAPMLGMSDELYAKVMTANLRLMKKLGRVVTVTSTTTSWSSGPGSAARSRRCG